MHWLSFSHTNKRSKQNRQAKQNKQGQSKPNHRGAHSNRCRNSLVRSPFLLGLFLVVVFGAYACGGGPGASLKPNAFGSLAAGSAPGSSTPGSSSPGASPTSISNSPSVNLLSLGSAGFGGDDTNAIQSALNTTAANGQVLRIPAGNYNISPISFPDNSKVVLDSGVTITANSGFGPLDKMLNIKSQNVIIQGAGATSVIFKMRKSEYAAEHASDGSEYRHCLDIEGASNVTVSGISCNQSGGDGLYIGYGAQNQPSQNVTVSDSIFDQNFRQGFSLISGRHIFVYRCYFTHTSGTNPESGIDIEPNQASGVVADVHIEDSFTTGNNGPGVKLAFWKMDGTSEPVDLTVLRHHSSSNGQSGYDANNNDVSSNVQGKALIQDSFSTNDGDYGAFAHWWEANGTTLIFQNLSISNPHQNGPDPTYQDSAAVALMRKGSQANMRLGNIQFQGVNITVNNGKVDRYFNFQDNAFTNFEKIIFNPGNLSGAKQVPPNGLVEGAGFDTVDQ